jgi:DNA repair protein RecO
VRAGLYGRQGAELLRLGECELIRTAFTAGSDRLEYGLLLGYFAELLEGFVQEGEADDAVYRLAVAVVRALEDGRSGLVMARYLEAWLLKLHGIFPPLRRCAGCDGTLPAGELRYSDESHGFVCESCRGVEGPRLSSEARRFLERAFHTAPGDMDGPVPAGIESLEPFQVELIQRHLERELRSRRVLRSVERGLRS